MADIRINSLPTTASASSSDDFLALDGATNGTRKLNAYSPTFGGNLTVSGTASVTGQINGSAGYQFRAASGTTYELLRYVGGTNNPGIFTTVNESTKKVTIFASGSLVSGQTLGLGAEGSEALTLGAANATLAGNLTVSGGQIALAASTSTPSVLITQTDSAGYSIVRLLNTGGTAQSYDFAVGGSGTGSLAQKFYIYDNTAGAVRLAIAPTTGNFLVGTTTDGGQKLQVSGTAAFTSTVTVASNFTISSNGFYAGGGTPGAGRLLYSSTAGTMLCGQAGSTYDLSLATSGGTTVLGIPTGTTDATFAGFILNRTNNKGIYTGTSDNCGFTWTGTNGEFSTASGSLILKSAGTTALTLDSSQNATFAGRVRAGTAVGTAKTVLIDAAFTTLLNVTKTFTVTMPSPSLASSFVLEVGVYGNTATGYASLMVKGGGYLGTSTLYEATELTKINSGSVTISSVTKANGSMTFTVINTSSSGHVAICYKQTSDDVFTTLPTITAV